MIEHETALACLSNGLIFSSLLPRHETPRSIVRGCFAHRSIFDGLAGSMGRAGRQESIEVAYLCQMSIEICMAEANVS